MNHVRHSNRSVQTETVDDHRVWVVLRIGSDRFEDDHCKDRFVLVREIPEESDQFRFLRGDYLTNLKGSIGLILTKTSVMRVDIKLQLSTRTFIPQRIDTTTTWEGDTWRPTYVCRGSDTDSRYGYQEVCTLRGYGKSMWYHHCSYRYTTKTVEKSIRNRKKSWFFVIFFYKNNKENPLVWCDDYITWSVIYRITWSSGLFDNHDHTHIRSCPRYTGFSGDLEHLMSLFVYYKR